uniref:Uncharacterized protein n=1 Tax=Magallana gigas TaxID=29159 RepID=A0A8W8LUJ7_MAGGI
MAYKSTVTTADIKANSAANLAMGSTTLVTVHITSSCHCNMTEKPVSMATTSRTTEEDHTVPSLHCDSGTSLQDNNGHYKLLLHNRLCLRWSLGLPNTFPFTCLVLN